LALPVVGKHIKSIGGNVMRSRGKGCNDKEDEREPEHSYGSRLRGNHLCGRMGEGECKQDTKCGDKRLHRYNPPPFGAQDIHERTP